MSLFLNSYQTTKILINSLFTSNLNKKSLDHLEAFTVDNGWSRLIILLLRDPHLLEG